VEREKEVRLLATTATAEPAPITITSYFKVLSS